MSQRQPPPPVPGWSQPTPQPAPSNAKKPIWQRWWFIAIAAIIVIGGLGQAFGGQQPTVAPVASSATPPTPTPVLTPPASTPPPSITSPSPSAPVTSASTPDAKAQATKIAAAVNKALKSGLGVKKSYQETCGKIAWACPIAQVRAGGAPGDVEIHVQEQLSKDEAKKTALYVFNFAGPDVEDLDWVIVYDSSQSMRGQMQRSDVPLLNR